MNQAAPERPRLRAVEAFPIQRGGATVYCLRDPSGESDEILFLSEAAVWMAGRMDGSRDLGDIQAEICRAFGEIVPRSLIADLAAQLESAGFLDSPSFRDRARRAEDAFAASPTRAAAHAGISYDADPSRLGPWIDRLVEGGPIAAGGGRIRALIAPHIDPRRGGTVYGSAYRSILGSEASRLVILGISHRGGEIPFAAIAKGFETPFGECALDRDALARLNAGLPFDPLSGASLHRREHSIEFQVLFLRHLLDGWEERRIVPILCCFPYLPAGRDDLLPYPAGWITAFQRNLESLIDEKTLVVAGVDFAHVGRRFGDQAGDVESLREKIQRDDCAMMERIAGGDLDGFRAGIEAERDSRRICGFPAITTLLQVIRDPGGIVLDYGQAVESETDSLVSFGAIAFR